MAKVLLVYEDYSELMGMESALKRVGFDPVGITNEYSFSDQLITLNPEVVVVSGKGQKVSTLNVGKKLKESTRWPGKVILIFSANGKPQPADLLKLRMDMMLEAPVNSHAMVTVLAEVLGLDPEPYIEKLLKQSNADEDGSEGRIGSPMSFGRGGAAGSESHGEGSSRIGGDSVFVRGGAEDSSLFPDVDLKSLESEILGAPHPVQGTGIKVTPEEAKFLKKQVDSPEDSSDLLKDPKTSSDAFIPGSSSEFSPEFLKAIQNEVASSQSLSVEKQGRYREALKNVKLAPKSTLSRVETRRVQKNLVLGWNMEFIKDLDKLRQQFVKALFRK